MDPNEAKRAMASKGKQPVVQTRPERPGERMEMQHHFFPTRQMASDRTEMQQFDQQMHYTQMGQQVGQMLMSEGGYPWFAQQTQPQSHAQVQRPNQTSMGGDGHASVSPLYSHQRHLHLSGQMPPPDHTLNSGNIYGINPSPFSDQTQRPDHGWIGGSEFGIHPSPFSDQTQRQPPAHMQQPNQHRDQTSMPGRGFGVPARPLGDPMTQVPGVPARMQVPPQFGVQMNFQPEQQPLFRQNGELPQFNDFSNLQQPSNPQEEQERIFWQQQMKIVREMKYSKENRPLPLATIKKIMKGDGAVGMVALEGAEFFTKACELFILHLTGRAFHHTRNSNRTTLQRDHIISATREMDICDFLGEIAQYEPREKPTKKNPGDTGIPPVVQ